MIIFHPINDQVLVELDVKEKSALDPLNDRPTVLPSGRVLAVGRGTFLPGVGFIPPQVAVGDHVAISLDQPLVNLPLADEKNRIFCTISEALILGKLEGCTQDSTWFKRAGEQKEPTSQLVTAH